MAAAVESNAPMNGGPQRENDAPLPPVPMSGNPHEELDPAYRERLQHVLSSDIGMSTLLNRLKQSISSTRDFAAFLKERSTLEERHAQGLKRLSRNTHDAIARPENRQGSFAQNYREITNIHDRMADHGLQYCNALFGMSEELNELAANTERGRKHWKQTGLNAEKRVQDAEAAMEKAKHRYFSVAEQYDRARTGERQSGKFGLRKQGAQAEEDLRHKVEAADAEYASKVEAAQSQRNDLLSTYRPQTVTALQELIKEVDAGLSVQAQKFANLSEKMLLGSGLCITPMKTPGVPGQTSRSLREVASSIDNEKDFVDYVLSFSNKAPSRPTEIKYEKHPSLSPKQQQPGFPEPSSYKQDSFGQNYPPTQGTQVSGVTPYPGEEYHSDSLYQEYGQPQQQQGQQAAYPPAGQDPTRASQPNPQATRPQGPNQMPSGPPQLPQIDSAAGNRFDGDLGAISPVTSDVASQAPGHVRNVSSIGSIGSPNQQAFSSPPVRSASPQLSGPSGQPGSGGAHQQMGWGRGQPPQGLGRGQPQQAMDRGQPQAFGRGQGPQGAAMPQPPQSMARGQAPPGGAGWSQGPQGQGPPGTMGRGQAPMGMGQPQSPGAHQNMPPLGAGRGLAGPSNGAPRPGGVSALPSRQAAPRAGPPLNPVFGVSLDELFQREGTAVPVIVMQCVQAVDLYGLNTEGIYRTSGSANHIMELRQQFDHDAHAIDFRNPAAFYDDIASVTTLLKHFLRDLPDPLLTAASYREFIQAARVEEDIVRRDSVHALVNALPDPNYATLRVLAIHLHRVAQNSDKNKMTHSNLAIVFAPTLMGRQGGLNGNGPGGADIADAGWQAKVVETILNNTFQIFDADE